MQQGQPSNDKNASVEAVLYTHVIYNAFCGIHDSRYSHNCTLSWLRSKLVLHGISPRWPWTTTPVDFHNWSLLSKEIIWKKQRRSMIFEGESSAIPSPYTYLTFISGPRYDPFFEIWISFLTNYLLLAITVALKVDDWLVFLNFCRPYCFGWIETAITL